MGRSIALNEQQVVKAREMIASGKTDKWIAAKFKVSGPTIGQVRRGAGPYRIKNNGETKVEPRVAKRFQARSAVVEPLPSSVSVARYTAVDEETGTMAAMWKLLEPHRKDAQSRILDYLYQRVVPKDA